MYRTSNINKKGVYKYKQCSTIPAIIIRIPQNTHTEHFTVKVRHGKLQSAADLGHHVVGGKSGRYLVSARHSQALRGGGGVQAEPALQALLLACRIHSLLEGVEDGCAQEERRLTDCLG